MIDQEGVYGQGRKEISLNGIFVVQDYKKKKRKIQGLKEILSHRPHLACDPMTA